MLSGVLRELPAAEHDELPDCPEMSDYARRLYAADLAFPQLGLYRAYVIHAAEVQLRHAADDPFVGIVRRWLEALPGADFTGSPTQFHTQLSEFAGLATAEPWWPKSAKTLSHKMIEAHRPLEVTGILYTSGWAATHGREVKLKLLSASLMHGDWERVPEAQVQDAE